MTTEIEKKIIELLEAGTSYNDICKKLGVYPMQIRRIKNKNLSKEVSANAENNAETDDNVKTNTDTNINNVSTNNSEPIKKVRAKTKPVSVDKNEIELERMRMELERERMEHELEMLQKRQEHELKLEQLKKQPVPEPATPAPTIETDRDYMQRRFKEARQELKADPDEPELDGTDETELDDDGPQKHDFVIWQDKNIEGRIEELDGDIVYVDFDDYSDLVEMELKYFKDGDDVWVYDDRISKRVKKLLGI